MKNLLTAVILGIAFTGISLADASSKEKTGEPQAAKAGAVKVAVVEFSPGTNVAGMTHESKRHLQASLAYAMSKSRKFDVVDVNWTRDASRRDLAVINGAPSTAAAVKLGHQLGVSYVLTGNVVEYTPKAADGFGRVILQSRLVDVATGQIKHAGETTQVSTSAMKTDNPAELHTRAVRPALEKLTETLVGLSF